MALYSLQWIVGRAIRRARTARPTETALGHTALGTHSPRNIVALAARPARRVATARAAPLDVLPQLAQQHLPRAARDGSHAVVPNTGEGGVGVGRVLGGWVG